MSHPQFRSSTPFSSKELASKTNISLYFTFPGFTLLENNQKRCSVLPHADESAVKFSHHFKLSSVKIIHNSMKAMTSKNIGQFGDRSFGRDQHQAKFISEIFLKKIHIHYLLDRNMRELSISSGEAGTQVSHMGQSTRPESVQSRTSSDTNKENHNDYLFKCVQHSQSNYNAREMTGLIRAENHYCSSASSFFSFRKLSS